MKKFFSKRIILSIIVMLTVLLISGKVYAIGGQAASNSPDTNHDVSYYFELIRAMETPTGTLGVNSNINTSNYLDSSANGIDCHLEKNTEYGTMALLALSEFGKVGEWGDVWPSTALGSSGVYDLSDPTYPEATSAVWSSVNGGEPTVNEASVALKEADSRYVNKYYGTQKNSITGDAFVETDGWAAENTTSDWFSSNAPVLGRGNYGILGHKLMGGWASSCAARAVVVCGEGL